MREFLPIRSANQQKNSKFTKSGLRRCFQGVMPKHIYIRWNS